MILKEDIEIFKRACIRRDAKTIEFIFKNFKLEDRQELINKYNTVNDKEWLEFLDKFRKN